MQVVAVVAHKVQRLAQVVLVAGEQEAVIWEQMQVLVPHLMVGQTQVAVVVVWQLVLVMLAQVALAS